MKRTIQTLLTLTAMLCLLVSCLTINAFATVEITSGQCGDNVTWELEGTTLYVRGTGAMWDIEYDNSNPYHRSLAIILGDEADKIVISEGITHIGRCAFSPVGGYWSSGFSDLVFRVKEIIIPSSVTSIGGFAFSGCTGLTSITLPNGITTISGNAFAGCRSLTSITIPDSVTSLGPQVFYDCDSLSSIQLSSNLTEIGEGAFYKCSNLSSIVIPNSVTSLGDQVFYNCESLSSIQLPSNLTEIGKEAFYNCSNLSSITLPDSLTTIGDYAFNLCPKLTEITFPSSITSFGRSLFYPDDFGFTSANNTLTSITFAEGFTELSGDNFVKLSALTTLNFPSTLTKISGFGGYEALTELTIPDSVTEIDGFKRCTALTSLTLPNSVTELRGFDNCTGLTSITIPDSVTTLDAFDECTRLSTITIPDSVTYLSGFSGCTGLRELNIPDSVTVIGGSAFSKCTGLSKVTIPNSVVTIEGGAFSNCKNLKEITIPVSVVSVGSSSFNGCSEDVVFNYQCGTEKQWTELVAENNFLLNAKVNIVHEWEEIEAADPTCTEDGSTAGKVCKLCGFGDPSPEAIPAIGHAFDPYEGSCTNCGEPDPAFVSNPFTDVAETDWFFKPVMWAKLNNVTGGTSPTTFSPDMGCTRAQVVTFLWAANGKPDPMSMYNPFTDVSDEAWYVKPVLWAVENGITGGTSATTFSPDATCTRAQIVTFLYAAQGKPAVDTETNPFTDIADTDWYVKPVLWAAENNITGGIGNNQFGPNNTCTRGQVVTFLFKVYENK